MPLAQQNFRIYRGDDWSHMFVFMAEDIGLYVTDAQFTNGVNQLIIPSGGLIPEHENAFVVAVNGGGIIDGTRIDSVATDGRSASMSGNATLTRKRARVAVGVTDISNFDLLAQVRSNPDAPTPITTFTLDEARKMYGLVLFKLGHSVTELLAAAGSWDLQLTDQDNGLVSTVAGGTMSVTKDISKLGV